jgi:hypothetical protein
VRAADLLGARAYTADDEPLGYVSDLRLEEAGTSDAPRLRLEGVVLARREAGRLLGYDHRPVTRPWLLALIARRMAAQALWVPWGDIADHTPGARHDRGTIRLRPDARPVALHDAYDAWGAP